MRGKKFSMHMHENNLGELRMRGKKSSVCEIKISMRICKIKFSVRMREIKSSVCMMTSLLSP